MAAVCDWFEVTTDVQVIEPAIRRNATTAPVAGIRANIDFDQRLPVSLSENHNLLGGDGELHLLKGPATLIDTILVRINDRPPDQ